MSLWEPYQSDVARLKANFIDVDKKVMQMYDIHSSEFVKNISLMNIREALGASLQFCGQNASQVFVQTVKLYSTLSTRSWTKL